MLRFGSKSKISLPKRGFEAGSKTFLGLLILLTAFQIPAGTENIGNTGAESEPEAKSPPVLTETKLMNELLESAFDAYVDEDYERSIANFEKVLKMNPRDKAAQKGLKQSRKMRTRKMESSSRDKQEKLGLARSLIKKEKWLDAMDYLSSVLSQNPDYREALDVQDRLAAKYREKMQDAKAPPGNDLVYQGMIHYLQKHYDQAILVWKEAAKARTDDFKTTIYIERTEQVMKESEKREIMVMGRQRAKAYFASGRCEEAAKLWQKILDFSPEDREAREGLAKSNAEFYSKNREALIGDHYDKGLESFNHGQFAESLKEWKTILGIDSHNEVAKSYIEKIRAKGLKVEGENETKPPGRTDALPLSTSAVSVPPPPADDRLPKEDYNTGALLRKVGNYTSAIEYFQKILERNPEDAKASELLEEVAEEQKDKAQKRYTQGSVKYSEGNVDEAMREWHEALKIDPNHAPTLKALNKLSGGKK